ncbi:methyltransferase type 11 [Rufibacter sp. DG15C]|uniref:class I SAM-dependent methyltransferase n=1 Tax=Rufibacter sp. DG15C TaxID=1379909 RepID=UPI00078BEF41|nr:class I SAM-dependent methyltransferase [Rufibacter sp. DG15C]AMM50787.1 methyltransferase type 11 [Rufibacter sp. DG15C]
MEPYQTTIHTWNKLASLYQEKFMDVGLYDDTYDRFCQLVGKPNARVLELGCGPGNITRYLLAKRPDFELEATDAAPNMVHLAQANNPDAQCSVLDCRNLSQLMPSYDAVVCGFCLPYLSPADCLKLIQDSALLLTSGGVLYLSFIEDDPQKSGYETSNNGEHSLYIHYYQTPYLLDVLEANGFELAERFQKCYPAGKEEPATHTILIARRN